MKKSLTFLAAVTLLCGIAMPAQSVTINFDEFISSPPTQDPGTPYYDNPITDEYAAQGIHFKSGPDTPASLAITLYGGDIFTAVNWDGSNFPVLPPTTQFLGLDKPSGAYPTTGIAMEFDNFVTELSFEHRRSGNSLGSITTVNIALFDTTQADWESNPTFTDQFEAYVDPSEHGVIDADGWLPYSETELIPFNLAVFYSNKKFAIDNLSYYGQWDFDRDDDVDGKDLADFTNASSATIEEDELASLAAKFGSTEFL